MSTPCGGAVLATRLCVQSIADAGFGWGSQITGDGCSFHSRAIVKRMSVGRRGTGALRLAVGRRFHGRNEKLPARTECYCIIPTDSSIKFGKWIMCRDGMGMLSVLAA